MASELNELINQLLSRLDSIEKRLSKLEGSDDQIDAEPPVQSVDQLILPEIPIASEASTTPEIPVVSEPPVVFEPPVAQEAQDIPPVAEAPSASEIPIAQEVPEIQVVLEVPVESPPPMTKTSASSVLSFAMDEKPNNVRAKVLPNTGLETRIGSYWLNRIGLLALLIGVVSLLLYSFQFFGPIPKIGLGFLIAAGVIYVSRMSTVTTRPWFSGGLNALGWSIAFFTGFAMYFVPGLHVIDSALLDFSILAAICTGNMIDAIRAKSEFTASQSTTFAALAIGLAAYYSYNPIVALLVLIAGSTYVSIRQGWYSLLLYSTAAYYATYFYLWYVIQQSSNWYWLATLGVGWLLIHVGVFFAQSKPDLLRQRLVWISVINALLGSWFASWTLEVLNPGRGYMIATAILGTAYLSTSRAFEKKGDESLSALHQLIGLSFLNMAKWDRFTGETQAVINIIQVGLLASIGLRFNLKAFTWFATLMALITTQQASMHGWWVGALAFSVYGCVAYQYRYYAQQSSESLKGEYLWLSNYYWTLGNGIAFYVIAVLKEVADSWKAVLYLAQGVINSTVLIWTRDRYLRLVTGFVLLVGANVWVVAFAMHGAKLPLVLGIGLAAGYSWYCHKLYLKNPRRLEKWLSNYYWTIANVITIDLIAELKDLANGWKALLYLVQGLVNSTVLIRAREKYLIWLTTFVLSVVAGVWVVAFADHGIQLPLILGIAVSVGYCRYCRELHSANQGRIEKWLSNYYWSLANGIGVYLITELRAIADSWKALVLLGQGLINSAVLIRTRDEYLIWQTTFILLIVGGAWSVVFSGHGPYIPLLLGAFTTAGYSWYCRKLYAESKKNLEKTVRSVYGCSSAVLMTAYIWKVVPSEWISTLVSIEGIGLILLWFFFAEEWAWPSGVSLFLLIVSRVFMFELTVHQTLLVLASSFGFYLYCHYRNLKKLDVITDSIKSLYCTFSSILLTVYLLKNVASAYLSIVTGVEAMVLVVLGFVLREKLLRVSGLVVFAIVIGRLLFIDFASAPTVSRIFSFIVSGVMLVGCSYAYGWFSKWLEANEGEKKGALESVPSEPLNE